MSADRRLLVMDERAAVKVAQEEERDPRPWWALELVKRLDGIERQQRWQTMVLVGLAPVLAGVGWIVATVMGG